MREKVRFKKLLTLVGDHTAGKLTDAQLAEKMRELKYQEYEIRRVIQDKYQQPRRSWDEMIAAGKVELVTR